MAKLVCRLPEKLSGRVREIAKDTEISANAWVVMALRSAVKNWDAKLGTKRGKTQAEKDRSETWDSGWPKELSCFEFNCAISRPHDPRNHGIGLGEMRKALSSLARGELTLRDGTSPIWPVVNEFAPL